MPKALVTGGGGFIGAHLGAHLAEREWRVDLLDDLSRGVEDDDLRELAARPGVRMLRRDLLDPEALADLDRDYELIFHLAAIVGVRNVLERPAEVLDRNLGLLANALALARAQERLGRFVFASTSEVYAGTLEAFGMPIPTPESVPLTVVDPARPRGTYMLSKLYGEAVCLNQGEVPVTIVRPHNVYGPRMGLSHVVPELLSRAHTEPDGGRLEVYSVEHSRTFCFVADAVEMLRLLATEPGAAAEVFNLGVEAPEVTIGELARIVVETVGRELELAPLPPTPGSPPRRAPRMAKLAELTGFAPSVELRDGVARTYEWYRRGVFDGGLSAR